MMPNRPNQNRLGIPYAMQRTGDGSWLCSEGPYRTYIAAWCKLHPNLGIPDSKNKWSPLINGNARVALLDASQEYRMSRTDFSSAAQVVSHLAMASSPNPALPGTLSPQFHRRIYILEGLAPDFVAALGDHFFMNPCLFMRQERTTLWGLFHEGSLQTPCLPSLSEPENLFTLKYYELRRQNLGQSSMWCARTGRNVAATRRPAGHNLGSVVLEPVGILHRRCSFWSRKYGDGGWDVVILCDPAVEQVHIGTHMKWWDGRHNSSAPIVQNMPNSVWSGGYLDFIKHLEPTPGLVNGPPRTCMLEDLCFYWLEHSDVLQAQETPVPEMAFMLKIALSHYMQLLDFVNGNIAGLEYQLSLPTTIEGVPIVWVEENWIDLQALNRRCSEYIDEVQAAMLALHISPEPSYPKLADRSSKWMSCDEDFQYILSRLNTFKARTEGLVSTITGLAGIMGNRQALLESRRSLVESKGIKTLTFLGMIFIPFAFCSGLLSMNDQYLPGERLFWVYFAVSVPLVVIVFILASLLNLGYSSDGIWTWKSFARHPLMNVGFKAGKIE